MANDTNPTNTSTLGLAGNGNAPGSAAGADVVSRVAQGAHATIDRLAETAAPVVGRVQESVGQVGDRLHAGADRVREMGDEWTQTLRDTVRERPITSLAVAVAVGMLLSRMASSR